MTRVSIQATPWRCVRTLCLLTATSLLAWGCAQPPVAPTNSCLGMQTDVRSGPTLVGLQYGTQHAPIPLNSVQFDEQSTSARLAVQGLYASRTATDTVRLDARFLNCVNAAQTVKVRTSFLRENQSPAEPTSAWRVVYLPAMSISHYNEFSTSREVKSFLIEVARE